MNEKQIRTYIRRILVETEKTQSDQEEEKKKAVPKKKKKRSRKLQRKECLHCVKIKR